MSKGLELGCFLKKFREEGYQQLDNVAALGDLERLTLTTFERIYVHNDISSDISPNDVLALCVIFVQQKVEAKPASGWRFADNPLTLAYLLAAAADVIHKFCDTGDLVIPLPEVGACLKLLSLAFEALEVGDVRRFVFRIAGLPSWWPLTEEVRLQFFDTQPTLRPHWEKTAAVLARLEPRDKFPLGSSEKELTSYSLERSKTFWVSLIRKTLEVAKNPSLLNEYVLFVERALELFIAAYSQLPVRRIARPVCSALQLLCRLSFSPVKQRCAFFFLRLQELDRLFQEDLWVAMDSTAEVVHLERLGRLQRALFERRGSPACQKIAQTPAHKWRNEEVLSTDLGTLATHDLEQVATDLHLLSAQNLDLLKEQEGVKDENDWRTLLVSIIVYNAAQVNLRLAQIKESLVVPDEEGLWGDCEKLVPPSLEVPTPIPRLGVQYLHMRDLFLRNYELYRLETFYEVRQDIEKAIFLSNPRASEDGQQTLFSSNYRMALPLEAISLVSITPPMTGEKTPQIVRGELAIDLRPFSSNVRAEWDSLRTGDLLYAVSIRPPARSTVLPQRLGEVQQAEDFPALYSILTVRTVEISEVVDEEGKVLTHGTEDQGPVYGTKRAIRFTLDPLQYQKDLEAISRGELSDNYLSLSNLLIRRRPETNNYRGVLACLKGLILHSTHNLLPPRVADLIVGFGGKDSAHPLKDGLSRLDFGGTFESMEHLRNCFPYAEIVSDLKTLDDVSVTLEFEKIENLTAMDDPLAQYQPWRERIAVIPEKKAAFKPLVRFTPTQIMAIRAGLNEGVSVIVGPPGTGKTDTAVQLVFLLQRNYKSDRVVIVARSNQALNDLFSKIVALGMDERYLLRLGMGEKELRISQDVLLDDENEDGGVYRRDFSKAGRANHLLRLRSGLLKKIARLTEAFGAEMDILGKSPPGEVGSDWDCELAAQVRQWILPARRALAHAAREFAEREIAKGSSSYEAVVRVLQLAKKTAPWWRSFEHLKCLSAWIEASEKERVAAQTLENEMKEPSEGIVSAVTPEQRNTPVSTGAPETITEMEETSAEIKSEEDDDENVADKVETVVANEQMQMAQSLAELLRRGSELERRLQVEGEGKFAKDRDISLWEVFCPYLGYWNDGDHEGSPFDSAQDETDAKNISERMDEDVDRLFDEVADCRPFELLRSMADRAEYMTSSFAKIIAMTSTHAALVRDQLLKGDFQYQTLIIEEAGQILDVESIVPMLLQKPREGRVPLKRIVMLGDHMQLAPVIQNRVVAVQGNLEQSLFSRLIRLGVPFLQFDCQGRCRSELADLFNWRYTRPELKDLEHIRNDRAYQLGNPGFAYTFQFVDCHEGKEVAVTPHYYQNQVEAEYVVNLYMYMRLLGYAARDITILTTYNGQKDLIKSMVQSRCGWNPLIGLPARVTTVDKYQGQDNKYVILSMVRTNRMGYLPDESRWTVALSRAKLGLYVIGHLSLLRQCLSLEQFTTRLTANKPSKLAILPDERCGKEFNRMKHDQTRPMLVQSSGQLAAIVAQIAQISAAQRTD